MNFESFIVCLGDFIFCSFIVCLITSYGCSMGPASYTYHLMRKYGNPYNEKTLEKHPHLRGKLLLRPFMPGYGKRYVKRRGGISETPPYKGRFHFFLGMTRFLYGLEYLYYFITFVLMFVYSRYEPQTAETLYFDVIFWGMAIVVLFNLLAIFILIPFGYIRQVALNLFEPGPDESIFDFWGVSWKQALVDNTVKEFKGYKKAWQRFRKERKEKR